VNGHLLSGVGERVVRLTLDETPWYYENWFVNSRGARESSRIPQWVALPVPTEWVKDGENEIRVSLSGRAEGLHPIRLFGQFSLETGRRFVIPSFLQTSIFRYQHDGEARLQSRLSVASQSRSSRYSPDGGRSLVDDLSPDLGLQRGTYHVFLAALTPADLHEALEPSKRTTSEIRGTVTGETDSKGVSSFSFLATTTGGVELVLWDDAGPLISLSPGLSTAAHWQSERTFVAYTPLPEVGEHRASAEDLDGVLRSTNVNIAGTERSVTPGQAAALQWYLERGGPAATVPVTELPVQFTGVYAVHLVQPAAPEAIRLVVRPLRTWPGNELGTSWANLFPPPIQNPLRPPSTADLTQIVVETPDSRVAYIGQAPASSKALLFMVHGRGPSAAAIEAPSAGLALDVPAARFVPTSGSGGRVHSGEHGEVPSYWAYASSNPPESPSMVSITVE